MEKRGRRRRNIPDMIIPLSTVEKRLDSYRDKREREREREIERKTKMVQKIGSMACTLTTTQIPNESCILVLSKVIPNYYTFRTTE
jgi:hypothetical protein